MAAYARLLACNERTGSIVKQVHRSIEIDDLDAVAQASEPIRENICTNGAPNLVARKGKT